MESDLRKGIAKVYRPTGFILLGALIGSLLTLAILGSIPAYGVVFAAVGALGLGIFFVDGPRKKPLFFLMISLLFATSALGFWMHDRKLLGTLGFTIVALIYAISAWVEYAEQNRKNAKGIPPSI